MAHIDYLKAILRCYHNARISNKLPPRLLDPSPANIRDECAAVYQTRFSRKDLETLKLFFDIQDESKGVRAIEKVELSKLRPLSIFLNAVMEGRERNTSPRNIQLLGWLLDFQPRPFDSQHDYTVEYIETVAESNEPTLVDAVDSVTIRDRTTDSSEKPGQPIILLLDNSEVKAQTSEKVEPGFSFNNTIQRIQTWLGKRKKTVLQAGSVALLVFATTAMYFNNKTSVLDNRECMLWTGDNFELIPCDSNVRGFKEPRNDDRLRNMHRITRPDTITKKHLGQIWYRKRGGGRIDFFTMGGRDPLDPKAELHQLTEHITNKYLANLNPQDSTGRQTGYSEQNE